MGILGRGLAAGAVGTTVLNAVTYLDMAIRGRPASSAPEDTVDALADRIGQDVPGRGQEQDNRRTALGALTGIASGLGIGVAASAARGSGRGLPQPLAAVATGAAAMAATDLPMAALGISDPRTWSASEWLADAGPHLAYGYATQATLEALDTTSAEQRPDRPSIGLVLRSALLGIATGARSSLGLGAPTLIGGEGAVKKLGAAGSIGWELYADKLSGTPDRVAMPGLPLRLVSAAGGAGLLAKRQSMAPIVPALFAVGGAVAGSYGGWRWRAINLQKGPDWPGAVAEDVVALTLAAMACLPGRRRRR